MHDILATAVVAMCLWAVVSPKVPTGIVCSAGLGMIALAAIWSIDDLHDPYASMDMVLIAVGVIAINLAWRLLVHARANRHPMRRLTDWREPMVEVPPRHWADAGSDEPDRRSSYD